LLDVAIAFSFVYGDREMLPYLIVSILQCEIRFETQQSGETPAQDLSVD
jgi:hypothetical protein